LVNYSMRGFGVKMHVGQAVGRWIFHPQLLR
jgi:hypothetical protein